MELDRTFFQNIHLEDVRGKFYRKAEVDALLREIETKSELLCKDNELLAMKLESVRKNISDIDDASGKANGILQAANDEAEKIISTSTAAAEEIMANAQRESEKKDANAHAECELVLSRANSEAGQLISEAQAKADLIVAEAQNERERILGVIEAERNGFLRAVEDAWKNFSRGATEPAEASIGEEPAEELSAETAESETKDQENPEKPVEAELPEDLGDRIEIIARTLEELDNAQEE